MRNMALLLGCVMLLSGCCTAQVADIEGRLSRVETSVNSLAASLNAEGQMRLTASTDPVLGPLPPPSRLVDHMRCGAECTWPFYVLAVLVVSFGIRVFNCMFKAHAIRGGAQDHEHGIQWSQHSYSDIFWASLCSFGHDWNIDDYWLPYIIGVAELLTYPILMSNGAWGVIGFWIGVKTAVSWRGWERTRTGYNRFLVGNIVSLGCSVLLSWYFFPQ